VKSLFNKTSKTTYNFWFWGFLYTNKNDFLLIEYYIFVFALWAKNVGMSVRNFMNNFGGLV
jgi:hypothetical protein